MSKSVRTINLDDLHHLDSTGTVQKSGIAIVTKNNTPIGIVTETERAQILIGQLAWNTAKYGSKQSSISAKTFEEHSFFIPTWQQLSTNTACFNQNFINDNWDKIQLNFPSHEVKEISETFNLPVFPHIAMHNGDYQIIQHTNNLPAPHVKQADTIAKGNRSQMIDELNHYDSPVLFAQKNRTMQNLQITPCAILIPVSLRVDFERAGIPITARTPRAFFSQNNCSVTPSQVLSIEYAKIRKPTLCFVVHPEPTSDIQKILDAHHQAIHPINLHPLNQPTIGDIEQCTLKKMEIGAVLAAHILESKAKNKAIGSWINSETHGPQHLAVTFNPKTIELIQQVPLPRPTTPLKAAKGSLFQYAHTNCNWFNDATLQQTVFENSSQKRIRLQQQIKKNLASLFEKSNSYVISEENGQECIITGNQDVARAMYTIEQHLGIA